MVVFTTALFLFQTMWHILCTFIAYMRGYSRAECITRIADGLAPINIFYIKVLQIIASNSSLLTEEELSMISHYADDVAYQESEIDDSWYDTLCHIANEDPQLAIDVCNNGKPIHSGTISVVYEGNMNGKKVAIKVLKRNIKERLNRDCYQFGILFRIITYLFSLETFQLNTILDDNRDSFLSQTDFVCEVDNALRMADNFHNVDYVWIPHIYRRFTNENQNMIVMEYVEGNKVSEVDINDGDEYSLLLAKFSCKSIFFDRFFHGDLHSGNIRFTNREGKKMIVIFDFGIMEEFNKVQQNALYQLNQKFVSKDRDGFAKLVLEHFLEPQSILTNLSEKEIISLRNGIADTINTKIVENLTPQGVFEVNKLVRKYKLSLSRSFSYAQMALCASSSVHATLGATVSFRESMKLAMDEGNNIWDF